MGVALLVPCMTFGPQIVEGIKESPRGSNLFPLGAFLFTTLAILVTRPQAAVDSINGTSKLIEELGFPEAADAFRKANQIKDEGVMDILPYWTGYMALLTMLICSVVTELMKR